MKSIKSQIWIETVIYTLIAIAIIGAALAVVGPKIEEMKDRAIIEQTISVMNLFDNYISDVKESSGNKRIIEKVNIERGEFIVDGILDKLIFIIDDSRVAYSENGTDIMVGNIIMRTDNNKDESTKTVTLALNYSGLNVTYNGEDEKKIFSRAPSPYKFAVENRGGSPIQIDISEIS
jgi:type II secretory pathway pseudopilin PulG